MIILIQKLVRSRVTNWKVFAIVSYVAKGPEPELGNWKHKERKGCERHFEAKIVRMRFCT